MCFLKSPFPTTLVGFYKFISSYISPCTLIMPRPTTFLLILALLLCSQPSHTARPAASTNIQHRDKASLETAEIEEGCEGISDEECLMRRTLVAHIDYIYTQRKTP